MKKLIARFIQEEEGVTAIEYGLIAALIAVGIVTVVGLVGDELVATFYSVEEGLGGEGAPE